MTASVVEKTDGLTISTLNPFSLSSDLGLMEAMRSARAGEYFRQFS